MWHSIAFPVRNKVKTTNTWPITVGHRTFFVTHENGELQSVGVRFQGVPVSEAPRWVSTSAQQKQSTVSLRSGRRLLAERDLRAWQSLLAAYLVLDIDYDSPTEKFLAESNEEKELIQIPEFRFNRGDYGHQGAHEFSILGRSFLAVEKGVDLIEPMAFYIEGVKARSDGRMIDSYNNFYLFLESRLRLKHKNEIAAKALSLNSAFCSAVDEFLLDDLGEATKKRLSEDGHLLHDKEKYAIALSIVKLRGFLRHHSLGNPRRWDPNEQERYEHEAAFLGAVCQSIAAPLGFDLTWDEQYAREFTRQARELGFMIEVSVVLTINDGAGPNEVGLNLNFPGIEPSPMLAKAVLENTLSEFDRRSPGAELLGLRARVKPNGPELFRYDLGPAIARTIR